MFAAERLGLSTIGYSGQTVEKYAILLKMSINSWDEYW